MNQPKLINRELNEIAERAEQVVREMRDFVRKVDRVSYTELKAIGDYIGKTRAEINALAPGAIAQRRLPAAGAELDALIKDSGDATERIMTAAEEILGCEATTLAAYQAFVGDRAMAILEACAFHDLNGQRVSKVTEMLRVVEGKARRFADELGVPDTPEAETEHEAIVREKMLHGPAAGVAENDQKSIDDLFA